MNQTETSDQKVNIPTENIIETIKETAEQFNLLRREIAQVIVGNTETISFILNSILCNGHILLEGVPGIAKTTMIKTIADVLNLKFKRIQFTPDLLPADLIGTLIYNTKTQEFETKKGPIFSNILLADEINRAPAKVQSALLECMQEHQVTIGSQTHKIDEPFLVFATQNPIEQEGTYQLPEAQLDRFLFKVLVKYPNFEEEADILKKTTFTGALNHILQRDEILKAQNLVKQIYVDEKIIQYIIKIIWATRDPERFGLKSVKEWIAYGVSPRATISIFQAAKGQAFLKKRHFVTPDDVKFVAAATMRHRIIRSYEAQSEEISADYIVQKILEGTPTP